MDTKAAAERLGTTPRKLRIFLRSDHSTFVAVGSGARYDFDDRDLITLASRFATWLGAETVPTSPPVEPPARSTQVAQDERVWEEEGVVRLDDIRDPAVRRRVRAVAAEQERRLEIRLLAAGLHITQMGRKSA